MRSVKSFRTGQIIPLQELKVQRTCTRHFPQNFLLFRMSIMLWTFPTLDDLATANSQQAKILTKSPVLEFVTGGQPKPISVGGFELLDVSYWILGQQALVSIVNLDYVAVSSSVDIALPFTASSIVSSPWGNVPWKLSGNTLKVQGLDALVTSLVVVDL